MCMFVSVDICICFSSLLFGYCVSISNLSGSKNTRLIINHWTLDSNINFVFLLLYALVV
uniref:Uncharacterized protein n=1 Tax=Octopus bimaculoides TaxID=37653 RepID=A0A0L8HWT0_OCTBM